MSCMISSCIISSEIILRLSAYSDLRSMPLLTAMTERLFWSGRRISSADFSRSSLSAVVFRTDLRWERYACLREEISVWQVIPARLCGLRSLRDFDFLFRRQLCPWKIALMDAYSRLVNKLRATAWSQCMTWGILLRKYTEYFVFMQMCDNWPGK